MLPFLIKRPAPSPHTDKVARDGVTGDHSVDLPDTDPGEAPPGPWQVLEGPATASGTTHARPGERVLVCRDSAPLAPKVSELLGVHMPPLGQVLAIWDPHCLWPVDVLHRLAETHGGSPGTTRLRHAEQAHAFAQAHHWHGAVSGGYLAVIHLQGRDDGSLSAPIGLSILEAAQVAAIVTGSGSDRDLPLKVDAFCRRAAWRGPLVQLLSIQGKQARADKLRRLPWPRSFKTRLTSYTPSRDRPWLADCLRQLDPDFTLATPVPALDATPPRADSLSTAAAAPETERPVLVCPPPISTMPAHATSLRALIVHATTAYREEAAKDGGQAAESDEMPAPSAEALSESLACAHLCAGFHGVAVVTPASGVLVRTSGDLATVQDAARALDDFWAQPADDTRDLSLRRSNQLLLAAAVPRRAGWWLLGVGEIGQAEWSQLRWQLQVAANTLAP